MTSGTTKLGVIADDITGATDVALMLARTGHSVVQTIGLPADGKLPEAEVIVIALKSRTIPSQDAIAMSLEAARMLVGAGARQILFKYCSTFDSRDEGNIGQVTEALMQALGTEVVVSTPAYPANKRSVFQGHLFVGEQLLSDSPMKDHPLTPMRDSNLVRVLQRQTRQTVGLLPYVSVAAGPDTIKAAITAAKQSGIGMLIADAIRNDDLMSLGIALRDAPLVAGGAGIALNLIDSKPESERFRLQDNPAWRIDGPSLIISGSCSVATQEQVRRALAAGYPSFKVDPRQALDPGTAAQAIVDWALPLLGSSTPLIYSTPDPDELKAVQATYGAERIGAAIEQTLAQAAAKLVDAGVSRLIIAGGETSGAVVQALHVSVLAIGPEIDPGVPWTRALDRPGLLIAAKSGNFGAPDFFLKAWGVLQA